MNHPSPAKEASAEAVRLAGIKELRDQFSALLNTHVPRGSRVAFIEFPYDTNVGNHMMWLAGLTYFAERGVEVAYPTHINGYDSACLKRAIGEGLIIFNGGVGLSALWPRHTDIKRRIVRDFPHNRILVFPSTVAFKNRADQDSVRDVFRGHENVFLMARDATTHAVIQDTFQEVKSALVPDSAFMLPEQVRRKPAEHPITWLVRNDHESSGYEPPRDVHTFDWAARTLTSAADFPVSYYEMKLAGAATRLRNSGRAPKHAESASNRLIGKLYQLVSNRMLRAGNDDLDRGGVVVTDRFHTHILAILRGQPVVLLADAFGKNENSFKTWTNRFSNVFLAHTAPQALEIARGLAAGA